MVLRIPKPYIIRDPIILNDSEKDINIWSYYHGGPTIWSKNDAKNLLFFNKNNKKGQKDGRIEATQISFFVRLQ